MVGRGYNSFTLTIYMSSPREGGGRTDVIALGDVDGKARCTRWGLVGQGHMKSLVLTIKGREGVTSPEII